jgi:hypothetical protein
VRLEGLGQLKTAVTSSGIELDTIVSTNFATPCPLREVCWMSDVNYAIDVLVICYLRGLLFLPEDGVKTLRGNFGHFLPNYSVSY